MGYTLASVRWPSSVSLPDEVKQLLESLFLTLDDSSESGSRRLAEEVFTSEGEIESANRAKGSVAIQQARNAAWGVITQRRHELLQVYAADAAGMDLMALGRITAGLKNGRSLKSDFASRVVLEQSAGHGWKVKYYQPIVDTAPVLRALEQE